jgi:hypothetical protein
MSEPSDRTPDTPLRHTCAHARRLGLQEQTRECVDQLGHPELIVGEVLDAFRTIEEWSRTAEIAWPDEPVDALVLGHEDSGEIFYPTREISVVREPCSFTCLASRVHPLGAVAGPESAHDGLDFVGVSCDDSRTPVLGTVESEHDTSAYPLLLRGLACLAEMSPGAQIERLNEHFFLGLLGSRPSFDLYLVLRDHWQRDEKTALEQLTRDLAEKLKAAIKQHTSFPDILRHIVCLRMNAERFDGRLRFDWRV